MKASRETENEVFRSCKKKKKSHTHGVREGMIGDLCEGPWGTMEGGVRKERSGLENCFIAYHIVWS